MSDNSISLRLFAEVNDQPTAENIRRLIVEKLAGHGEIVHSDAPKTYWKIPAYYEVFVVLRPSGPVSQVFDNLLMALAPNWVEVHRYTEGSWAVWNASPDSTFFMPEVRWANLECGNTPDSSAEPAK